MDGSLRFRFTEDWQAIRWESAKERIAVQHGDRKTVDIIAAGLHALLLEAKDDRIKDARAKLKRAKAVKQGDFAHDLAAKFRDSVEGIESVSTARRSAPLYEAFRRHWDSNRRLAVLWWELPPDPPSGAGTRDDRWKAHLSALQNTLKSRLKDVTPRVRIANQRFDPGVVPGMDVSDIPQGIDHRRKTIRPSSKAKPGRIRKKGPARSTA